MSPVGYVGPLQLGEASATEVQRFAGRADFLGTGTFEAGAPDFLALAYDCSTKQSRLRIDPTAYRPSHMYCRTVYYINAKTRVLAAFFSSSPAFHTRYGTHPGSTQAYANAHEDGLPEFGCHQGMSRDTAVATLLLENRGGHPRDQVRNGETYTVAVLGGVVNDFALELQTGGIGLLFC